MFRLCLRLEQREEKIIAFCVHASQIIKWCIFFKKILWKICFKNHIYPFQVKK